MSYQPCSPQSFLHGEIPRRRVVTQPDRRSGKRERGRGSPRPTLNSDLRVKSPLHLSPMLTGSSPPGGNRTPVLPCIRRALDPGLSYRRAIRSAITPSALPVGFDPTHSRLRDGCSASLSYRSEWQGWDSNPRRAGYEPAARPLSYPAMSTAGGSRPEAERSSARKVRVRRLRRARSNPHGHVAHDVLSVARMHSATAAY